MFHVVCKTEEHYRCVFSFVDENRARDYYNRASAVVVERGGECSLLDGERLVLRCSSPTMTDVLARSLLSFGRVKLFDEIEQICHRALGPITQAEVERAETSSPTMTLQQARDLISSVKLEITSVPVERHPMFDHGIGL